MPNHFHSSWRARRRWSYRQELHVNLNMSAKTPSISSAWNWISIRYLFSILSCPPYSLVSTLYALSFAAFPLSLQKWATCARITAAWEKKKTQLFMLFPLHSAILHSLCSNLLSCTLSTLPYPLDTLPFLYPLSLLPSPIHFPFFSPSTKGGLPN